MELPKHFFPTLNTSQMDLLKMEKKHFLLKNKNPFILHFLLEGKIFYRGKKEIRKRERRGKRKKENVTKKEKSI